MYETFCGIALTSYWNDFSLYPLGNVLIRGELRKYAKNSNFENFQSTLYSTSVSMPLIQIHCNHVCQLIVFGLHDNFACKNVWECYIHLLFLTEFCEHLFTTGAPRFSPTFKTPTLPKRSENTVRNNINEILKPLLARNFTSWFVGFTDVWCDSSMNLNTHEKLQQLSSLLAPG